LYLIGLEKGKFVALKKLSMQLPTLSIRLPFESILQPTPSSSSSSSNHVSNSEENGIELHPTSSTLLNSNNPRGNYSQLLQQP